MAGKNGGRRPGAGRKPGVPQGPKASTIRKAEAREAHRRVIEQYALRMIRSQVAAAIGIGHVYTPVISMASSRGSKTSPSRTSC
jgi:hypothetical protein